MRKIGVLKIRKLWVVLVAVVILAVVAINVTAKIVANASPKPQYVVVIDAGHGGRDDGCSGADGTIESEINLAIAKRVESILQRFGFGVIMTRQDSNGLYDEGVDNYKDSDMEHRKAIIEAAKPDFVVSIHQNSYSDTSVYGAQAYWQEGNEDSEAFAKAIQTQLQKHLGSPKLEANYGDYYILKCVEAPSAIVECGYLTNAEEEGKLASEEYQQRVAYAIACGILKYFGYQYNGQGV